MMTYITPLQLAIIMSASAGTPLFDRWFDAPNDYVSQKNNSQWRHQATILLNEGIIIPSGHEKYLYQLTHKGRSYLEAILSIPFPVSKTIWEIPK